MPRELEPILARFHDIGTLRDFATVEALFLNYDPARGAHIEPHFDDSWLWGERLISLSLLSSSTMTMTSLDRKVEIDVPMPPRSLLVMSGAARHEWKHSIRRDQIRHRRLCVTIRELSTSFIANNETTAAELFKLASIFI